MDSAPYLYQINYSPGGVPKRAVPKSWVSLKGLCEDGQRNKKLHGGPNRAICLFSLEIIQALQQEGHTIYPGAAGENFTLSGLEWVQLQPGDSLKIGEHVHLEVTSFCEPCRRISQWFHKRKYHRIDQEQHPGWSRLYARVLTEGQVRQGDRVWMENCSKETLA